MSYSRFIDSDGILTTMLSGVVTLEEFHELEGGLCCYLCDGDVYELVLHSDDVEIALDSTGSITSAYCLRRFPKGPGRATIALVSDRDFIFGLCRQFELQTQNDFVRISVFRMEEAAHTWLINQRSLNQMNITAFSDAGFKSQAKMVETRRRT